METRLIGIVVAVLLAASGCGSRGARGHAEPDDPDGPGDKPASSAKVTVELRTTHWVTYPCLQCHKNREPDPRQRTLTQFHGTKLLNHGSPSSWCYRCHAKEDQGLLVLSDGTRVGFDLSYELCGSCHGDKYRDWRADIHSLTTGQWNGAKVRRSCTACHDPHNPHFAPMTPEPPPVRPPGAGAADPEEK